MNRDRIKQDVELSKHNSNDPEKLSNKNGNESRIYGVTKQEIEELFNFYKDHLRESEYERLKALGGINGFLTKLKSDPKKGLCNLTEELRLSRIKEFDDNVHEESEMTSCCGYVWEAFKDTMIRILIIAAIVQIVLGVIPGVAEDPSKEWIEGFSILVAIIVVVGVGSITNYTKELSFRKLNEKTEKDLKITLIRDDKEQTMSPDDVLVGDIVLVKYGDNLKVDGIILEAAELEFDESPLTGESLKKNKITYEEFIKAFEKGIGNKKIKGDKIGSSLVYSGSSCSKGNGKLLCLRVGKNSEKGKIEAIVQASQESEDSKSPLEEKLDIMANDIGKFGLLAAVVTLVALIIRFGVGYHFSKIQYDDYINNQTQLNNTVLNGKNITELPILQEVENPNKTIGNKILKIILLCIAIIVVAIPEGLPLAVTLSLAFAIAKMQAENNLVRYMTSCETMGTANYICSDKTGTLTTGKMSVVANFTSDDLLKKTVTDGDINTPTKLKLVDISGNQKFLDLIIQSIALNIDIIILTHPSGAKEISANSSDKAFYEFLQTLGKNYEDYKKEFLHDNNKTKVLPFDSDKKCMSTLVKNSKFGIDGWRVFHKGGADEILKKIKYIYNTETNKPELITQDQKNKITKQIKRFAEKSFRNFILAYKDVSEEEANRYHEKDDETGKLKIEQDDFIFIELVGIEDPLKDGVNEAVLKCNAAGVKIIMVTGDNIETAISISSKCNILKEDEVKIVRHTIEEVEKQVQNELEKIKPSKGAAYEEVKESHNVKQEDLYAKFLREFKNRKFLAMEGKELSERVGLICKTCGKSLNDRFIYDESKNFNDEVIMKLTNGKGASGTKKCYCLPNEKIAKKFFKDNYNRELKDEEIKKYLRKEELGNKSEFEKIIKDLCVIARAKPEDKYLLVAGLRFYRNVVAVTGDGTNDAPALSKADVGFSMGIAGTSVAKDASDIILLDDNFCSIVNAVKWGRNIFDCIRKFIQFQLVVNICACLLVFITACIGNETPLNAIQMLWVNLIMDSLGSLALATEPPNLKVLERKPYKRSEYPVSVNMWKHIILQSSVQLGIMLLLYLHGPQFLIENEPSRMAEADLLFLCFNKYPGQSPLNNSYFIMDGSENAWGSNYIRKSNYGLNECGPYGVKTNLHDCLSLYDLNNGNTSHMTIVFNTFVIYTLFNQLNSRILDDSFNIFMDIHKNFWFICIEILEFALHAVIIQFTSSVFKVSRFGLTGQQWGICIGFGSITLVVNFIAKLIPDGLFCCFNFLNEKESEDEQKSVAIENISSHNKNNKEMEALNVNNEIVKQGSEVRRNSNKIMTKSDNMLNRLSRKMSNKNNPSHKN